MYFGFSNTKFMYGDIAPKNLKSSSVCYEKLSLFCLSFVSLRTDPGQKKHSLVNELHVCCFSLILSSLYLFMLDRKHFVSPHVKLVC